MGSPADLVVAMIGDRTMELPMMLPRTGLIALWAHPRSRSTAFFRMMQNRGDCHVIHEPFCTLQDTGAAEVSDPDGGSITVSSGHELIAALSDMAKRRRVFVKDTTEHRYRAVEGDASFLRDSRHCFLIREPWGALVSHYRVNPRMTCAQVGYENLYRLYEAVTNSNDARPLVIDADRLVEDPARTVATFCEAVGLPFDPAHLLWPCEDRAEWKRTREWHRAVSESTGFQGTSSGSALPREARRRLESYYRHHVRYYRALERRSLR